MGIANDDQAFFFVGNVEETIERMDGLLFVLGQLPTEGIHSERRG